jgi:Cu-Zn family superoxide dismutase
MRAAVVILSIALLALGAQAVNEVAVAKIFGAVDTDVTGWVRFVAVSATQTNVTVYVSGIVTNPDGQHGMHIHAAGDISYPNGTATGTHWTPKDYGADGVPCAFGSCTNHGCPENTDGDVRHAGDMGNWQATGGVIDQSKVINFLPVTGMFTIVGHAVILHANEDECTNATTTGNSGARIAQGVIAVAKDQTYQVTTSNIYSALSGVNNAACFLRGTTNAPAITGFFYAEASGESDVMIAGFVTGLNVTSKTRKWGIHVHQFGDLVAAADGSSAGSHWNPGASIHALPPSKPRHAGDLGNIQYVDSQDYGWYKNTLDTITLANTDSLIGRALIIHELVDDGCTQSSATTTPGNSGKRLAWCTWGYGLTGTTSINNVARFGNVAAVPTPPAQTGSQCGTPTLTAPRNAGAVASVSVVTLLAAVVLAIL